MKPGQQNFLQLGALPVIREASVALFLQHCFLCFPPQLPQPTAVNTLQTHGEQLLFPGHVQQQAPEVSCCLPRLSTAWWVRQGIQRGFPCTGRQKQSQALSPLPVCQIPSPQEALAWKGGPYRLPGAWKAPFTSRGVFLVSHTWLCLRLHQILASNTSNSGQPSVTF